MRRPSRNGRSGLMKIASPNLVRKIIFGRWEKRSLWSMHRNTPDCRSEEERKKLKGAALVNRDNPEVSRYGIMYSSNSTG
jgi:hypothetical protein